MFNRNSALALVANTTPEQCAQMASLFEKLAEVPRGPEFRAMVRRKLADAPAFDRAEYLSAAHREYLRRELLMSKRGWLPGQMRAKLEELRYQPILEAIEVPSVETFLAWQDEHDARPPIGDEHRTSGSERNVWEIIGQASQAECRELATLFGSLVEIERDAAFYEMIQGLIGAQPTEKSDLEIRMEEGSRRVIEGCHIPVWRTGWHSIQMLQELARQGWHGADNAGVPSPGEIWAFGHG